MPLFQYLQSEYYGKPTPLDVIEPIQDALDYLAVSLPSDGIDTEELKHRNYVNDRLITLRNTFSNMFKPLWTERLIKYCWKLPAAVGRHGRSTDAILP